MEAIFGILVILLVFALAIVYNSLSWGLVVYKFWGWFILPIFTQLPNLSFAQAVGLMFFMGLFHGHNTFKRQDKDEKETGTAITILSPWLTLLIGCWVYLIIH